MNGPDDRFGSPFDNVLQLSTLLEDGRSLGGVRELIPIVAHVVSLLGDAAVGREVAAALNNELRILGSLTPAGEPTMLSTAAYLRWTFDGRRVALHTTQQAGEVLAKRWAADATGEEGPSRERSVASTHSMDGLDELMFVLQHDDDGQALLGEYDDELALSLRAKRPKPKEMPLRLRNAEVSFGERLQAAAMQATSRASTIVGGYRAAVDREVRTAADQAGLGVARDVGRRAVERVTGMERTLLKQRDALKEELQQAEAVATGAFEALEQAAEQIRTGWLKGLKQPFKAYSRAATNAFRLRFALALTEAALAALGERRALLQDLLSEVEAEQHILRSSAEGWRKAVEAFVAREVSPVAEITDRRLYDRDDLAALYQETCGTPPGSVGEELDAEARRRLGGFACLLGERDESVRQELLSAILPTFDPIASMTADDFVRWKAERQGRAADLFLRDCELAAPLLCRFDRARLVGNGAQEAASFVIVGVPDRDRSAFSGTPRALLVSTGDVRHVVFLRLQLGFPASALWQADRYHEAHDRVKHEGRVAQGIYEGFPHELSQEWRAGPDGRGKRSRRRGPKRR